MTVKELKPILEILDENIEVEFSIVNHSRQDSPKMENRDVYRHRESFSSRSFKDGNRDVYRTCGSFTFGHARYIVDPQGLNVECWPIYNSVGLIGYLRKTNIISICDKDQARTKGFKYWKRVSRHDDQLLQAIVDFVCVEYDSYRNEFQTLFTLEDDWYFASDDYPEFDDEEEEEDYWNTYHNKGIVPLVYFVK